MHIDQIRQKLPAIIAVALIVLLAVGFVMLAPVYVEFLWFESLGFDDVFTTVLVTKATVGFIVGVLVAAVLLVTLKLASRWSTGLTGFLLQDPSGTARTDVGPLVPRFLAPAALLGGLFFGVGAADHWGTYLRWMHATSFGTQDPILGYDVGFYLFELPALETALSSSITLVGLCLVATTVVYFLRGAIVFTGRSMSARRPARVHLTVIGVLAFLLLAVDAWLAMPHLMYSDMGPVGGASYADVTARLPALRLQVGATVVGALLIGISAMRPKLTLALVGIGLYVAVEVLAVRAYPSLMHKFSVLPNEAQKEADYIEHNIAATRAAYGLADVAERELTAERQLTRADIDRNRATIDNIRLWDHQPLLDTFAQIQEIRTYYEFASVDNDRYMIDGELRQTMLSPRELSSASLPNRTWINEHFTFTHGYGITLGPVNTATNEGLPQLLVQDIPPVSKFDELTVTRPAIYFGEMSNEYVFVGTANREFDYPQGEENVYRAYEGTAGVALDSLLTRAATAMKLGSVKLLLSDDIDESSRILLYRNIRERVRRLMPFLTYDDDPYMVLRDNGQLVWIQDAYTVSRRYPYSEAIAGGVNYIRNSVKVVIDAYDGTVSYFIADDEDPVLRTWRSIFPGAFRPLSEMPEDIRRHVRYPEYIFNVQTQMFTVYHMGSAELVYNREDQWEVPTIGRAETRTERMTPYYTIMRLPGEDREEFIQMLPFTPKRKDNLAAWMVARSDGEHLGELVVYRFPKDTLVFGPQQVMNRIDQEEDISRQISLWDQRGSSAIMGTMLIIPVEESLLYVVPLYLRAEGGEIPELKRVIVVYQSRIAMEPTLDGAMTALFGPSPTEAVAEPAAEAPAEPAASHGTTPAAAAPAATSDPNAPALAARAQALYEQAVAAQRRGDWAAYGGHLRDLGQVLDQLAE